MKPNHDNNSIFGIRPIIEAINSGATLDRVFIQKGLKGEQINELKSLIKSNNIESKVVPVEKLNRLTRKNHQGVFAFISPVDFIEMEELVIQVLESGKTPLFLILDQVSDVRNFGAIVRTAECTGVDGIIIPKQGSAPVSGDAMKTATGAIYKVPISKVDNLKDAIYYLQSSGVKVFAATEKTDSSIYDEDFTVPAAIVMGNEHTGVTPGILKIVDQKSKLPLLGEIGSLNVSVACGAFLYETVRQRLSQE